MPTASRSIHRHHAADRPPSHARKYSPRRVARETSLLTNAQAQMGGWKPPRPVEPLERRWQSTSSATGGRLPRRGAIVYDKPTSARGPRTGPPVAPVRGDCRPWRAGVVPSWPAAPSFPLPDLSTSPLAVLLREVACPLHTTPDSSRVGVFVRPDAVSIGAWRRVSWIATGGSLWGMAGAPENAGT